MLELRTLLLITIIILIVSLIGRPIRLQWVNEISYEWVVLIIIINCWILTVIFITDFHYINILFNDDFPGSENPNFDSFCRFRLYIIFNEISLFILGHKLLGFDTLFLRNMIVDYKASNSKKWKIKPLIITLFKGDNSI